MVETVQSSPPIPDWTVAGVGASRAQAPATKSVAAAPRESAAVASAIDADDDSGTRVSFAIDRQDNQVVVKVVDPKSQKVLRQIPADQLLRLQRRLDAYLGSIHNVRA